jgi:opacity protein-like surface antigen
MKKVLISFVLLLPTILFSQTHLVTPGKTAGIVSFGHDQNVDFFGEGKFIRDSYGNGINLGYVYNGMFGIDFSYGYSSYDRKDTYSFDLTGEQSNPDGDPKFNFNEDFRSDNPDVGDKGFSLGLTYYLDPNLLTDIVNLSVGLRYGSATFSSTALDSLNQDFYGKSYALEFGVSKSIPTDAQFVIIPRLNINMINEKNIYDSDLESDGTKSFSVSSIYTELAVPFIFEPGVITNETSISEFFVEPSIANKYGTTHIGLKFGFLLN